MFLRVITETFKWLLQQSILASILILSILVIRKISMYKVSTKWLYGLWFIVILKLIIPVNIQSDISLLNILKPISHHSNYSIYGSMQKSIFLGDDELNRSNYDKSLTKAKRQFNYTNNKSNISLIDTSKEEQAADKKDFKDIVNKVYTNHKNATKSLQHIIYQLKNLSIINVISLIWFMVAVVYLIIIIGFRKKFIGIINKSNHAVNKEITNQFNCCKKLMHVNKNIEIVENHAFKTPAIFGLIKPVIIMPKDILRQIDRTNLKYIFLHELYHYKRKDVFINYIVNVLKIIYWFNPLIWYGFAKMHEDREVTCDERVLAYLTQDEQINYGQTIIDLLKTNSKGFNVVGAEAIVNRKSSLKRRIDMIKNFNNISHKVSFKGILAALVIAGLLLTVPKATIKAVSKTAAKSNSSVNINTNKTLSKNKVAIHNKDLPKNPSSYVTFKDKNFEKLVRIAINKPTGSITKKEALRITKLLIKNPPIYKDDPNITSISGIENFTNLKEFQIDVTELTDISPLSSLHKLKTLNLYSSYLKDIRPLGNLHKLQNLKLVCSPLSDISPLKSLTNLKTLDLSANPIRDVTSLKGLYNLESLDLSNDSVQDISPLKSLKKLKSLSIELNKNLKDISALREFTWLTKLEVGGESIKDISALKNLIGLRELTLMDLNVKDTSFLNKFTKLNSLAILRVKPFDMNMLKNMTKLRRLDLETNEYDVNVLKNMRELKILYLSGDNLNDINGLARLSKLRELDLTAPVRDISCLKKLNNLEKIKLSTQKVSDISSLANLNKLKILCLDTNELSNINTLARLTKLELLSIQSNKKIDLTPLRKMNKLKNVILCTSDINTTNNVNILKKLTNLKMLHLISVKLDDSLLKVLRNSMPNCQITTYPFR